MHVPDHMYVLKVNDKGQLGAIDDIGKESSFFPNASDTDYQQLLKWINSSMEPTLSLDDPLPPETLIFLRRHALVEYCRRRGLLLYATNGAIPYWKDFAQGAAKLFYLSVGYSRSQSDDKLRSDAGIVPHHTNYAIPESEWLRLNIELKDEDSDIRRVSCLPVKRTFLYLDVSDFSRYQAGEQALIINSLGAIVSDGALWTGTAKGVFQKFKTMLCIGDGYIFVFDEPVKASFFAGYLAYLIELLVANNELPVEFHFRMGAHVGLVYSFWDPGRENWNYVGDGINGGNRVLAAVGKDQDDVIFVSSEIRKAVQAAKTGDFNLRLMLTCLTNRGRKSDKHGNPWRVYEMNHAQLCANEVPERFRS